MSTEPARRSAIPIEEPVDRASTITSGDGYTRAASRPMGKTVEDPMSVSSDASRHSAALAMFPSRATIDSVPIRSSHLTLRAFRSASSSAGASGT